MNEKMSREKRVTLQAHEVARRSLHHPLAVRTAAAQICSFADVLGNLPRDHNQPCNASLSSLLSVDEQSFSCFVYSNVVLESDADRVKMAWQ